MEIWEGRGDRFGLGDLGGRGGHSDPGNLGGRGGQKTLPSVGGGGVDFFWNNPMSHTKNKQMLCNWGCISYVKSRAMALNLVEYKSPVQNVIAYARSACLLFSK